MHDSTNAAARDGGRTWAGGHTRSRGEQRLHGSSSCKLVSSDAERPSARPRRDNRPPPTPTPPRVGTIIDDRYVLLEPLGRGASGWVWKAKHRVIGKVCAVKILAPQHGSYDSKSAVRMLREATALSKVEHPGVVEVSDFGYSDEGTPFIAMEFLEGQDLRSALRERRPSTEQALVWGRQLLQAVAAAHNNGIVHRDIKPANIFVSAKDNRIKLLDFGLARLANVEVQSGEWDGRLTPEGELLGSPATMSPEQLRGDDPDARSDMYSVGCVLYEMFAGRAPVQGRTTQVLYQHMYEAPPELREFAAADTPDTVLALVQACLAKEPEQRPTSAQAAHDTAQGWRVGGEPTSSTRSVRARLAAIAGLVGLIAVVALAISGSDGVQRLETREAPAASERR